MRSQSQQIIEIFGLRGLRKSFKVKVKETIRSQTFKSTFSKTWCFWIKKFFPGKIGAAMDFFILDREIQI